MLRLLHEVAPGLQDAERVHRPVIAVPGVIERVGQHARAVDPFPPEQVGRDGVGVVPVHLDGEERVDTALFQQLRQPTRKAEAIGQPAHPVPDPEFLLEVALPIEDLPRQALAGGHVGVGLDPHAADRLPAAGRDLGLDLLEQRRIVFLDLRIVMRRRLVEAEARLRQVLVAPLHQRHRRREGAAHLPPCLGIGPEPGEVDMGMSGQRDLALLREALLQCAQPLDQFEIGGDDALALRVVERRRVVLERRQLPDLLLAALRREARHIVLGARGPVERVERLLGRCDEVRHHLVLPQFRRRFMHLAQAQAERIDRAIEPVQPGVVEVGLAHRLAEGQPRHRLRLDAEIMRLDREFLVIRVVAEADIVVAIDQRRQRFAPQVEEQPCLGDRPARGHRYPGGKALHAIAVRPRGADLDRLAVQCPAADRHALALPPPGELVQPHLDPVQPLLDGESHAKNPCFATLQSARTKP